VQFVDFRPGDASLDAAASDNITAITEALVARPELKLTVPIGVVPELDRPALAAARFAADLDATARSSPHPAAFAALPAPAQLALLTDKYRVELSAPPRFPEADKGSKLTANPNSTAHPNSAVNLMQSRIDFLSEQLQARIRIDDAALQSLGQQRALALQAALLAQGRVDPARVFLAVSDKSKPQDSRARLELALSVSASK
jgi:hypothetical protein